MDESLPRSVLLFYSLLPVIGLKMVVDIMRIEMGEILQSCHPKVRGNEADQQHRKYMLPNDDVLSPPANTRFISALVNTLVIL